MGHFAARNGDILAGKCSYGSKFFEIFSLLNVTNYPISRRVRYMVPLRHLDIIMVSSVSDNQNNPKS